MTITAPEYASPYNLNKKIAPDHFQHVLQDKANHFLTTETSKLINNITFQIRNTKFKTSINTAQFYGKQLMYSVTGFALYFQILRSNYIS